MKNNIAGAHTQKPISAHAKGEWIEYGSQGLTNEIRLNKDANGNIIVNKPIIVIIDPNNVLPEREVEANAKLIAAAPDMLQALKFAKSVLLTGGCYELSEQLSVENIEAAIKKATE